MSSALKGVERTVRHLHEGIYLRTDPLGRWTHRNIARAWRNPTVRQIGTAVVVAVAMYFGQEYAIGALGSEGAAGAGAIGGSSAEGLAAADAAGGLIPAGTEGAATTIGDTVALPAVGGAEAAPVSLPVGAEPTALAPTDAAALPAGGPAPLDAAAPVQTPMQVTPVDATTPSPQLAQTSANPAMQAGAQPLQGAQQGGFLDRLTSMGGDAWNYLKDPKNALVTSSLIKMAGGALSPNETAMKIAAAERQRQSDIDMRNANQAVGRVPLSYANQYRTPFLSSVNLGG